MNETDPGRRSDRPQLADVRRREIADWLREQGSLTVAEIEARFGVTAVTVRRDLTVLEGRRVLRRTHGGAVLPSMTAHEDAFSSRIARDVESKLGLAERALREVSAGETVFLDSSTTSYQVARRIIEAEIPLMLITNSLPVMTLVANAPDAAIDLIGLGGSLRPLTQSFVGPETVATASRFVADKAFLSVKGITPAGELTDPDPQEAEVKRLMVSRSGETIVLADASKLAARGRCVVGTVSAVSAVFVAEATAADLDSLRQPGVRVEALGVTGGP